MADSIWSECSTCGSSVVIPTGEKGDSGTGVAGVMQATSATISLTEADSGQVIYLARAAGVNVSLPLEPEAGTNYKFVVRTSVTSNNYSITASTDGVSTDYIGGFVFGKKASTADEIFTANGTSHTIMSMNGTTTGGLIGTSFEIVYDGSNIWRVSGYTYGSGTLATCFS